MIMVTTTERLISAISEHLEDQERNMAWLARKAGINYPVMIGRMHGRTEFTGTEIVNIAQALGIRPGQLTDQAEQTKDAA